MAVETRLSKARGASASSAKTDDVGAAPAPKKPARKKTDIVDVFARVLREREPARPESTESKAVPSSAALDVRLEQARATAANPGPESKEVNPRHIVVWLRENRLSSDGVTAEVGLSRTVRLSADGIKLELVHVSGASVLTSVQNHQPFAKKGDTVTQDAFDQAQALQTADAFLRRLAGYGIDLASVYRDARGNSGVVRIIANAMSEENAGYIPGSNVYVFGTSEGRFHLVSCKEILVHELAHGYFDHIAPGVNSDTTGEGKPLHEALGDLFAALHFENPNISEDLGAYLAEREPDSSPPGPLRTLANDVHLDPTLRQEHKRSLAYSGMVWSVTERLAAAVGKSKACDLMLGAVAKVPFFVTNKSPTPADCLRAFLEGVRSHFGKVDPELTERVLADIGAEAKRRNIGDASVTVAGPSNSAKLFESSLAAVREQSDTAFAGIARGLPELSGRDDVAFEVLGDRRFGDVRRVTLRALVQDPASRAMIPVEDGQLEVVLDGNSVRHLDGPALRLPAQFDFTNRAGEGKGAIRAAKRLVAEHLAKEAERDPSAATVKRGLTTLFADANLKVQPIFSEGRLRLEVITLAGEFIVDLEQKEVRTRRLMHVYDVHDHATA